MVDIHGEIPNIVGSTCEALIEQEFWYQGEKSTGVHILFLKIENSEWQRFFFDCGTFCCKEVEAPDVWNPKLWEPTPNDYQFPQTEIGRQNGLVGQVIQQVELVQPQTSQWPEFRIHFSNGTVLRLQDFCDYQILEFQRTRD